MITRSSIIGASSGALIVGALWNFAGHVLSDAGLAFASLLGGGRAGEPTDPWLTYRWGVMGIIVCCFLGGLVGAICKNMEHRWSGGFIGALAAGAGLTLSLIILMLLLMGSGLLGILAGAPVFIGLVSIVLAGAVIGVVVRFGLMMLGWPKA